MSEILSRFINLRFESEEHSRWHHYLSVPIFDVISSVQSVNILGQIPKEGPAILLSNHVSGMDPFWIHYLAYKSAGRTIRTFAKASLVDPTHKESAKALEGRSVDDVLVSSKSGLKRFFRESLVPFYTKGFNPYVVEIGVPNSDLNKRAMFEADKDLKNGRLVCMFPQGHRKPEYDLLDMMPGAFILAKENPNVPIYAVGLNLKQENRNIKISQDPFLYRDVLMEKGHKRSAFFMKHVAKMIAFQVDDPQIKGAWSLNELWGIEPKQLRQEGINESSFGGLHELLEYFNPQDEMEAREIIRSAENARGTLFKF